MEVISVETLSVIIGPNDPTTPTSMKTSLKNRLRIFPLFSRLFQVTQLLDKKGI